ncbi:monocarboxylate transporter 9 [Octopus bimaculoides]|uniref:Major facilitator superfamily (MFS) profile domain-containing protein n=1 Tax=Octopus bimaculoides TaxID=37653 RepID=A0A0L8I902_OCTBM|nr:monocarboxylate transporter 9 [Octopus bimaculoides]XP_014785213.1 monocarboxylate transporter 9 [Octopus bimaculoides]XP_014785218.1 monocarboxylate transporter 9 [Octopus bimaculoides]XP_014785225.1 monocarboxylate transporter 9 [Octopus bimaculoides]XP_052827014.1 monocarboxylate transporter 9 [Octopus bimaculoides]XP_052827015.1 monocarboxylate transporter 9 [Octopus bimaculoides]|eukprot:XP_014785208.1 PREDICTED: monocarboxylate transporter 9-like [Octopus bimaculoides]
MPLSHFNFKYSTWRGISVILGGIIVHLALGSSYIIGNFSTYFISYMRMRKISPDIQYTDTIWIVSVGTITTGFTMFLSGILEKRLGSRITILLAGWLMSGGLALTYLSIKKSFLMLLFSYGFLYGIGNSIAYPVSINCVMKWFPKKEGTVAGIVLTGYGVASFIWNPFITLYINPENEIPDFHIDGEDYFSQKELLDRIPNCFLVLGIIFSIFTFVGGMLNCTPPSEEKIPDTILLPLTKNANYDENEEEEDEDEEHIEYDRQLIQKPETKKESEEREITPKMALKTRQFYLLWLILLFLNQSTDFFSSLYKAYGQTFIHDDYFLAMTGALGSVGNAISRLMWGFIGDKISFKWAMLILSIILAVLLCSLSLTELGGKYMYSLWVVLLYLTFPGTFALLPAATHRYFGKRYYLIIYGMLFSTHIVSGSVGCLLAIKLKPILEWHGMFLLSGAMAAVCMLFTLLYNEKCKEK